MDLEMSRHYPQRGMVEWDYRKGELDAATKDYALETCRRVKKSGGLVHGFLLGRTLEQDDIVWLQQLLRDGHVLGNHTYDHVKLNARTRDTVQSRFRRCPWLIEGKTPRDAIVDNIRMTERAMQHRLGIAANGFRTPYGYPNGLMGRQDLQEMLLELGYSWVSSQYRQPQDLKKSSPTAANFAAITRLLSKGQPFVYPSGLIELPLSPITDVNAFRTRRWKLSEFLTSLTKNLQWTIENLAMFDYCFHPSVMCIEDPQLKAIELICLAVRKARGRAAIVDLGSIADNVLEREHANA